MRSSHQYHIMESNDNETESSSLNITHDEVLQKIGGCGYFAKLAAVILISAIMAGDFVVNIMAFYELIPTYECQIEGTW